MPGDTLKIAYFIDRLIRGGTELQLVEQINRLAAKGIQQELFCLYKSPEHEKMGVKCPVHVLGISKLLSPNCFGKLPFLRRYLKRNSFNIVQTYFFDSTVVGVVAGKLAQGPKIFSCRRDLGFWYTPRLLLCLKFINKMTDRILVNSNAVKESVVKKELANPEKISVIPNGIDIHAFEYSAEERRKNRAKLGIDSGQICVGMITNMSRKVKRVDLFVDAAAYVLNQSKDFHFLVLGDGRYLKELIARARSLGIEKNVSFLGRDVSKHKVLPAMDIGVLTSDSEGFSNAVMEYMAVGLPVIATAVGGNLDLVEDGGTGLLTIPDNPRELGERTLLLGKDRLKRMQFGEKGKNLIAKHNWDAVIDQIMAFYQKQIRE